MNAICFAPIIIGAVLASFFTLPHQVKATNVMCALFITVSNPLVQSFFRQDIKFAVVFMLKRFEFIYFFI